MRKFMLLVGALLMGASSAYAYMMPAYHPAPMPMYHPAPMPQYHPVPQFHPAPQFHPQFRPAPRMATPQYHPQFHPQFHPTPKMGPMSRPRVGGGFHQNFRPVHPGIGPQHHAFARPLHPLVPHRPMHGGPALAHFHPGRFHPGYHFHGLHWHHHGHFLLGTAGVETWVDDPDDPPYEGVEDDSDSNGADAELTVTVINNTQNDAEFSAASQDRGWHWPSDGTSWDVPAGTSESFTINGMAGEEVCEQATMSDGEVLTGSNPCIYIGAGDTTFTLN